MYIKEYEIRDGEIYINIMGQKFREYVNNEIDRPPQSWMLGFGKKLQYVGMMIEQQSLYGKNSKVTNTTTGEELISIGFDEKGQFVIP